MDFDLNEDERSIRSVFGDFFAKESGPDRVREAEPLGHSTDLWQALTAMGVPAMGLPSSRGGDDATLLDLTIVAIEAGRRLAPVPFAEAVAATRLLGHLDGTSDLLAQISAGEVLPTLALRPPIAGVARLVPAAAVADIALVLDGDNIVLLEPGSPASPANLGSSPLADVSTAAGRVIATGPEAQRLYRQAIDEWRVLTAALLSGLQAQALDIGVEYAKTRKVFGIELGWFQTIQHRLADHASFGEGLELLTLEAAWSQLEQPERFSVLASSAFLAGADIAFATAKDALQFHGGYGFTLEYDIQLYFRRAKAWPLALGPIRDEYQHLAEIALGSATNPKEPARG